MRVEIFSNKVIEYVENKRSGHYSGCLIVANNNNSSFILIILAALMPMILIQYSRTSRTCLICINIATRA